MNKKLSFLILTLSVFLQGCIPSVFSVFPLHDESSVVFVNEIIGNWVDKDSPKTEISIKLAEKKNDVLNNVVFKDSKQKDGYVLTIKNEDGSIESWGLNIIKIENQYFLNIACSGNDCFGRMAVGVNLFAKLQIEDQDLNIALIDKDKIKFLLDKKKININYVNYDDDTVLITGGTQEIQKMLMRVVKKRFNVFTDKPWLLTRGSSEKIRSLVTPEKTPK